MRKNDTYVILLVTNQSGCDYSFLATIGFIAPDKKMINSRHTGMIIWIIKILRRLHDTFYKQNVLSLAFRQRVGIVPLGLDVPKKPVFMRVSGLGTFRVTVFATDEIVTLGLQLNLLTYRQGGEKYIK